MKRDEFDKIFIEVRDNILDNHKNDVFDKLLETKNNDEALAILHAMNIEYTNQLVYDLMLEIAVTTDSAS